MTRTVSLQYDPNISGEITMISAGIASLCYGKRSAIYLSTPVTTGTMYVRWVKAGREASTWKSDVLTVNVDDARKVASDLRARAEGPVICPVDLPDMPEWLDDDFMDLWLSVIRTHVKKVYANAGWELSNGCVSEVTEAIINDIPVRTLVGGGFTTNLTVQQAMDDISAGREIYKSLDLHTAKMDYALVALQEFRDARR